jgi:drug/metabolite transporter (DMT)-like permease
MHISKRAIGVAAALITVAIWTSFIVIARAMAHRTLTPFDIGFVRFVAAAIVMIPWGYWWVQRERAANPESVSWLGVSPLPFRLTAIIGVVAGIGYSCLAYSGFLFAPAAHASVLMPGMLPLWTALLAFFILRTPVPPRRAIGLALIACGALFVGGASLLQSFEGGGVLRGDVLFLSASFCWGLYTVLARKNALGAIQATIAITVFTLITYVPIYGALVYWQLVPSHLSIAPWSEILLQGFLQGILSVVVSGITFVKMVEVFGPVRSTMITAVVPSLSAVGAVVFLGEPLYWNLAVGLALATVGILFGVKSVTPTTVTTTMPADRGAHSAVAVPNATAQK